MKERPNAIAVCCGRCAIAQIMAKDLSISRLVRFMGRLLAAFFQKIVLSDRYEFYLSNLLWLVGKQTSSLVDIKSWLCVFIRNRKISLTTRIYLWIVQMC